jgi:nucleotide-binding universal stress UspA family protein
MRRLLVALDGSPRARGVLEGAIAFATRLGGKLVLVRASTIAGELPAEAYFSGPDAVDEVLRRRSMDDLRALAEGNEDRIEKLRVEQGPAWEVIDRVAREEHVDAIVIGAHGYGLVERVLGTVASRVVNHASHAVLVVREPERLR